MFMFFIIFILEKLDVDGQPGHFMFANLQKLLVFSMLRYAVVCRAGLYMHYWFGNARNSSLLAE